MRLIDADAINPMRCPRSIAEMRAWLDEQPTAYDVDKVVEEFDRRYKYHLELSNRDFVEHGRAQAYRSAIDVVKRGGVE